MKPPKDKRTKEYKEWKEKYNSAPDGLGDVIEKVTKATGIKKAVEAFTDDCGCDERKKKLNNLFRFKPVNCFSEEQYNTWTEFRNRENQNVITQEERKMIMQMLRDIFNIAIKDDCSSCSGAHYKKWIGTIDKFYESY